MRAEEKAGGEQRWAESVRARRDWLDDELRALTFAVQQAKQSETNERATAIRLFVHTRTHGR